MVFDSKFFVIKLYSLKYIYVDVKYLFIFPLLLNSFLQKKLIFHIFLYLNKFDDNCQYSNTVSRNTGKTRRGIENKTAFIEVNIRSIEIF